MLNFGFIASGGKLLSDDVTHYVVPDWKVLQDYLEILEFPELKGLVFMQTACQAMQQQRGRRYLVFCGRVSSLASAVLGCISRGSFKTM